MSREAGSHKIDDQSYVITMMPPKEAQKILIKLMRVLGNSIEGLGGNGKKILNNKLELIAFALGTALQKLNEVESEEVMDALLGSAGCRDGMDDPRFHGKLSHMYKVAQKAAEVNFKDFLEGIGGTLNGVLDKFNTILEKRTSTSEPGDQSSPG